jgi:amino acid transporter
LANDSDLTPSGSSEGRFRRSFQAKSPTALPALESFQVPERVGYRIKNKLLGPPLVTESLAEQRLGKPTALAILSSDVMSSSAYATEAMLGVLVPAVGVAAFSLIIPVSLLVIVVLIFVTASYLEVIKAFPRAGGAYIVARETFGSGLAQVAAASLFVDYTLTVAVSVSAGVDALASAIPALAPYVTPITVLFVILIAYGNLRGIREAGKTFALPTFLFIGSMLLMIAVGLARAALGHLHKYSFHHPGAFAFGHPGPGLLLGASLFIVLKSFASGGTALTGTEAISNGVSVFKEPQPRNARITLVWMSIILGTLFLGVSVLSYITHAVPYVSGTPTVLSQVAEAAFGQTLVGHILYIALDIFTMGILTLAANTSFTGLPYLASFAATDGFLPRKFMQRGHRLVFSSTILILTFVVIVLLIATNSNINALISLYAIGVFTGFTIAGVGMVKHHLVEKEPHWRRGVVINGSSAVLSALVDLTFIVTKFTSGAWLVVVVIPILIFTFFRFHRRYLQESQTLQDGISKALQNVKPAKHKVLILVDRVDLATARALRYARTLTPDEIRAVHFVLDEAQAKNLAKEWDEMGLSKLELEMVECQDRRIRRAAAQIVLDALYQEEAEVSVLIPHRVYGRFWGAILHDQTANQLSDVISQLPGATAILVPYRVETSKRGSISLLPNRASDTKGSEGLDPKPAQGGLVPDAIPIGNVQPRKQVKVTGRISAIRTQSFGGVPTLTARLEDSTGGILLVFPGRKSVAGITYGASLVVWGTAGEVDGRLAILNPLYEFLPDGSFKTAGSA